MSDRIATRVCGQIAGTGAVCRWPAGHNRGRADVPENHEPQGRPRLLDLFCGAGGAARGYADAGFEVLGVDVEPQPKYPFEFVQADALSILRGMRDYPSFNGEMWRPGYFAAIHASPPCQGFTAYRRRPGHVAPRPNLIPPVRVLLSELGLPYVIENVPGAPLENPVTLCGSSFRLDIRRHRCFESNVDLEAPPCDHGWQTPRFPPATNRTNLRRTVEVGVWRIPLATQRAAMGIDWMGLEELSEAIPPAYTRCIGDQLMRHMAVSNA